MKGSRLWTLVQIWEFIKVEKKWFLAPPLLLLVLLGLLILFAQTSAFAPLLYTIF